MLSKRQLLRLSQQFFLGTGFKLVVRRRRVRRSKGKQAVAHYQAHKEAARTLVHNKLEELNRHYGFTYHKVAIRDQSSRWGSCSKRGNLNFNYRLVFLPETLVDAIIVHELCHLKEFNHSKKFWLLMAETIPDYASRKKALAKIPIHTLGRHS